MSTLTQTLPTETKPARPVGNDTPVSNQSEEAATNGSKKTVLSQASSEGANPQSVAPKANGVEDVPTFNFQETTPAATPEAESIPDLSGLRDIGEASFGAPRQQPVQPATVHGPDNRVQITSTAIYPWRAIASLLITAADNSLWIGTGWFIGPHTIMTAGHVVYIKNSGVPGRDGWVKKIQVMPGRNGNTMPYGSVISTSFRSTTGWTNSGNENFDYGAIILPTNLGSTTGWFGFGVYGDSDLLSTVGNSAGYPGDKPSGTMWFDAHRIASVNSRKVFYDIDTAGGQSGSAVYRILNGQRMAFAVHAYGGATTNSGTRITQDVYNNMVAWKA